MAAHPEVAAIRYAWAAMHWRRQQSIDATTATGAQAREPRELLIQAGATARALDMQRLHTQIAPLVAVMDKLAARVDVHWELAPSVVRLRPG